MIGGGYRVLWMQNTELALVVVNRNQKTNCNLDYFI